MSDALQQAPAESTPAAASSAPAARDPLARDPVARGTGAHDPVDLALVFDAMSTSARAALATADVLRLGIGANAVALGHLFLGCWADERGHVRRSADRAGLGADRLRDALAAAGLEPGLVGTVPRARLVAAAAVRAGRTALPPLEQEAADALHAAARVAGLAPNAPRGTRGVHSRHLVAGVFAAPAGPLAPLFEDVRREVDRTLQEAIASEVAAGRVAPDDAAHEQRETDALWAAALADAHDLADAAHEKEERPVEPAAAPAPPRTGGGGGAGNDRAEGVDRLNFEHYVRAFADLVDSPDTRPPLTVGIFGAWGAGKSFLLRGIADELARRAATARPSLPRSYGQWLRRLVRREPPPARRRAHVYTVAFNAWEYNAAEHIWPRLVRRVLDEVTRDAQWHRRPLRWAQALGRKLHRNFWRKLRTDWKSLVAWLGVGAALGWTWTTFGPDTAVQFTKRVFGIDASDDGFSVPAIVGALTAAVKLVVDTLLAPLGGWVTALLDDGPGYGAESDFVRAVRADLDLVDRQLGAEGGRVLVVVDDLDRCEPDKAVEVLQAINLLLDRRTFVVCLGIDARVITAAVEKHYEDLLGPAGITGYEYLDKIVQIPFRIPEPTPTDLARFVAGQLGDPPPPVDATAPGERDAPDGPDAPDDHAAPAAVDAGAASASTTAFEVARRVAESPIAGALVDRRALEAGAEAATAFLTPPARAPERLSFTHDERLAFEEVAEFLRANPRHVKRLVNVYALVRSLAALGGARELLDAPRATVRWLTLCAQWPYAVREMLARLDARGAPAGEDAPLPWLLDAVRDALEPSKRRRFDHDDATLDRLVSSSGDITWEQIRVLRRYTVNFNPALDAELRAEGARRPPLRVRRGAPAAGAYDRRRADPA